jgi:hypothetical protein
LASCQALSTCEEIAKKKIVIGCLNALLLTGCSKLNRENYDQLKMGMSNAEASTILGKAECCDDALGTTCCLWGGEGKNNQDPLYSRQGDILQLGRN